MEEGGGRVDALAEQPAQRAPVVLARSLRSCPAEKEGDLPSGLVGRILEKLGSFRLTKKHKDRPNRVSPVRNPLTPNPSFRLTSTAKAHHGWNTPVRSVAVPCEHRSLTVS